MQRTATRLVCQQGALLQAPGGSRAIRMSGLLLFFGSGRDK
jgi:hypothetical protein